MLKRLALILTTLLRIGVQVLVGMLLLRFVLLRVTYASGSTEGVQSIGAIFRLFTAQYGVEWPWLLAALARTSLLVVLAVVLSSGVSLVLGYRLAARPHARVWDYLNAVGSFLSGVPLFVAAGIMYFWFRAGQFQQNRYSMTTGVVVAVVLILGLGEGVVADWTRHFRLQFRDLHASTYFAVRRARGQSALGLAARHIAPFLLSSTATRISYFFGGIIILEHILYVPGVGRIFIDKITDVASQDAYLYAMVSGTLILAIPILVHGLLNLWMRLSGSSARLVGRAAGEGRS
jgi:ABC-type dipeptide/oligopeptide/nickel transport system permease component